MKVSVLIATRGRTASLPRTLESLFSRSNLETDNWEALLIIDSDCDDGSADICREFERRFPNHLRVLVQPASGKSNALNFGIRAAQGEILALTDDDVLVAADYVRGVRAVFTEYPADAVQGRILIDCDGGFPGWIPARMAQFVGLCDYGDDVQEWTQNRRTLYGTSMAVRTEVARRVGGFAPELGAGTDVGFCEDTEFSLRLRRAGCRLFYAPQIVVRHQLSRARLTRSFFRKRYFGFGRSQAYYIPRPGVPLWRYAYWEVSYALSKEAEAIRHLWANRPADALDCQCLSREHIGSLVQHCRFWLGAPRRLSSITVWPETVV